MADEGDFRVTPDVGKVWAQRMVDADGTYFMRVFSHASGTNASFTDVKSDGLVFTPTAPVRMVGDSESRFSPRVLADHNGANITLSYYDAAAEGGIWQDTAMTVPATSNGDPVQAMTDLSGRGKHLIWDGAGSPPTLYKPNGHRWTVTGSGDSTLKVGGFGMATSHGYFIGAVRGWGDSDYNSAVVYLGNEGGNPTGSGSEWCAWYKGGSNAQHGQRYNGLVLNGNMTGEQLAVLESTTGHRVGWLLMRDLHNGRLRNTGGPASSTGGTIQGDVLSVFGAANGGYTRVRLACFMIADTLPSWRERQLLYRWCADRIQP